MTTTRRQALARAGAAGAAVAFSGALSELFAGTAAAQATGGSAGYGPLVPDPDGLLDLPKGFRYKVLSREGDPLPSGEGKVPSNCDGMAAFAASRSHDDRHGKGTTWLVRNHENRMDGRVPVPTVKGLTYDPAAKGGCTVLELDRHNNVLTERVGIAGTSTNCAGGPSLWDTWLTCEETEFKAGEEGHTKDHGYIFEVGFDRRRPTSVEPLTAMGRFQHEAVAFDPHTGVVYETEDAFEKPFGLFYRFLPKKPKGGYGSLHAGGRLEAMRVPGVPDLSAVTETGKTFDGVEWVEVPDPLAKETPVRLQDFGKGGITHAQKLEGVYWGGSCVYFVSSYARSAEGSQGDHFGQIWRYDPKRRSLTLVILFGPGTDLQLPGEEPDNICLAPSGGLMVCEDGAGAQHVFGLTRQGKVYAMARGAQNLGTPEEPEWGEFAGVTFSPDHRTMYVNCYTPGTTFAITGPWHH
ncbi:MULTISPECIES: alkaline phosphatase PhoX [unclassified Streptomyces]|uniref:alkaline phosphatase PhoX n=1 Tax=unclassified Streptomyces TaxID=2593676 RepID=UPI002DD80055|nr:MULTISPECIES: alkaline phosphatase PhoX [unclassified Streptomyces]WSA91790.1 PhoX family protein [Streptomyces sp. NBC_01795]WSB76160.1 PhoX family protein [Streptomyces sp. NBC_01775]WSS15566.1 PhoX family protein [Streptomyces sp. NBC_01186]WSS44407.1 PhoX family protein [Streptomyces sp. NBC_01187]